MAKPGIREEITNILKLGFAPEHVIQAALRRKYQRYISGSSVTARIREIDGVERGMVKGLHCYRIGRAK